MKNIKNIAKQIARLEQECQQGINVSKNLAKMEELMSTLPFDKMLELNLILEKKFLTK